ncbi:hypothetical protein Tco_1069455 [Tanacetum coccineum]|uniref:Uncharacterized protein n=1 Tax=Tanacetum coccineum TaxID=301880 RepID=A0ABQ5HIL2_9ASTR
MASESTSSQQSSHLSPSSKVNFKYEDGIIAFNNAETVRAGLATLGLCDKDKPSFSSTVLVNSSPLKIKYFTLTWRIFIQYIVKCLGGMQRSHDQLNLNQQTITYSLIWGLEIDIGAIIVYDLVHKLQNEKKNKEANICYTRFLSLIFEKLPGENYINDAITFVQPHTISTASFQKPLASEVALTSHMLKVAKLFQEPGQSLILSSEKVNVDDGIDKVILPKKQVAETQHAEETVATADATQSLEASESAEDQVLDQNVQEEVQESGSESIGDVTFDQIMDEIDQCSRKT